MTAISIASRQFTIPVDASLSFRSTASTTARTLPGDGFRCSWNPIDYGGERRPQELGELSHPQIRASRKEIYDRVSKQLLLPNRGRRKAMP